MKTKILLIILLFIATFSTDIFAQQHIQAVIKKTESIESVEMTVVRRRNSETKQLERVITTINIKSNPSLINEFIDAFKKDEANATQAIDKKKNGRMIPEFYRFGNFSYSFSIKNNGDAEINVIESHH
ncbi:MAG TPA: hypothetical protein DIT04_00410 [Dysgonomonas sp.]|nr:hypothetical protein [Dysgonomonas sp.]